MVESRAMPAWCYRDPAEVAERVQVMERGCSGCVSSFMVMGVTRCEDQRNDAQKGVPFIGPRCRYFKQKAA